jgi:hypothetical protein
VKQSELAPTTFRYRRRLAMAETTITLPDPVRIEVSYVTLFYQRVRVDLLEPFCERAPSHHEPFS